MLKVSMPWMQISSQTPYYYYINNCKVYNDKVYTIFCNYNDEVVLCTCNLDGSNWTETVLESINSYVSVVYNIFIQNDVIYFGGRSFYYVYHNSEIYRATEWWTAQVNTDGTGYIRTSRGMIDEYYDPYGPSYTFHDPFVVGSDLFYFVTKFQLSMCRLDYRNPVYYVYTLYIVTINLDDTLTWVKITEFEVNFPMSFKLIGYSVSQNKFYLMYRSDRYNVAVGVCNIDGSGWQSSAITNEDDFVESSGFLDDLGGYLYFVNTLNFDASNDIAKVYIKKTDLTLTSWETISITESMFYYADDEFYREFYEPCMFLSGNYLVFFYSSYWYNYYYETDIFEEGAETYVGYCNLNGTNKVIDKVKDQSIWSCKLDVLNNVGYAIFESNGLLHFSNIKLIPITKAIRLLFK